MKKILSIILIINCQLSIVNCNAQTISPKVTPTSGGYYTGGGNSLSWTMGETFTQTLISAGNMLTQGFQQPVIIINTNNSTVYLKLFLQGYYLNGGTMQPVLNNDGVANSLATQTDTIVVELHDQSSFALLATKQTVLQTDGTASATFAKPAGSYYIAIKHRNTIQTWSANPVACNVITALYDFTTAANKAFGANQAQVEPGVWAFFTGDINQDEFIDGNDFPDFDTDSYNGVTGEYKATDMNGDGFVDGNDFPVFDGNSFNGVTSIHP